MNRVAIKKYNFRAIKKFIEENKDAIEYVEAGMLEDWFWTAEKIYKDGKFLENFYRENIAGIDESYWATPVIKVVYKNGRVEYYLAFVVRYTDYINYIEVNREKEIFAKSFEDLYLN